MEIVKTKKEDVSAVMEIIGAAKRFFRENGIDQWQNGKPNEEMILADIENGESYIVKDGEGNTLATAMISMRGEPTYDKIFQEANLLLDGNWLHGGKYCVIHRVAVLPETKRSGAASLLFSQAEKIGAENGALSVRLDTHRDNIPMQKAAEKNGFTRCGVIYLENDAERFAYEKYVNISENRLTRL